MARKKRKSSEIVHNASSSENYYSEPNSEPQKISRRKGIHDCALKVVVCENQNIYSLGYFTLQSSECSDISAQYFYVRFVSSSVCTISWTNDSKVIGTQVESYEASYETPFEVIDSLLKLKNLYFSTNLRNFIDGKIDVYVYLDSRSFILLQHPSEPLIYKQKKQLLCILRYFLGTELDDFSTCGAHYTVNIENVFDSVHNHYSDLCETTPLSHDYLIPKLRNYQCQAVNWMLNQERKHDGCEKLHMLYQKLILKDSPEIYLQKYGGFIVKAKYLSSICKGGILADEMGLGKTVEVLACILLNPRTNFELHNKALERPLVKKCEIFHEESSQDTESEDSSIYQNKFPKLLECICGEIYYGGESEIVCTMCGIIQHAECILAEPNFFEHDYTCPNCTVNSCNPVPSGATLIVSPASILYQWEQEISKHIVGNHLKVFMYLGVNVHKFIDPKILAGYDIVLTAYETFRKELNHANIPHGDAKHSLRCPKKFSTIPSPLPGIEWWRICLDEAQMVESVNTKISQMAWKLHSVNRWCVTGTPIQKSIQDLFGIMVFLRFDPYHEKTWWQEIVKKPYSCGDISHLSFLLNNILWRTTKKNVLDQIGIPKQHVLLHKLELSAVEKINYSLKHETCRSNLLEQISKYQCNSEKLRSLDRHVLSKIMLPLRKLQQACSYFENVSIPSIDNQPKKTSMPELLKHLLKKGKYDCEEAHRKYIMSMNGVAGIHFIREDYTNAIQTYQDVLKSIEDHKENIRTDVSQQIHAMHNLSKSIAAKNNKEGIDENSSQLPELEAKISEIRRNYLLKYQTIVENCKMKMDDISEAISDLRKKFNLKHSQYPTSSWWAYVYEHLTEKERSTFIRKIHEVLISAPGRTFLKNDQTIIHSLESSRLLSVIHTKSGDLYDTRQKVVSICHDTFNSHTNADIQAAVDCHLRPDKNKKSQKCKYCKVEAVMEDYEAKLFRFDKSANNDSDSENENFVQNLRRGTHADSELELVMKIFSSYCKHCRHIDGVTEDGVLELKLIDFLKKEFKILRNMWLQVSQYIAATDEIEMAKTSARLLLPGEEIDDSSNSFVLTEIELGSKLLKYRSEIIQYLFLLKKKLGQLFYLKNLEKAENKEGPFDEMCPICQLKLENTWSVLQCGHSFCIHCVHKLCFRLITFTDSVGMNHQGIRCPVCREPTAKSDIYYIEDRANNNESDIKIKGSYSTKVQAIIRCLLGIKQGDVGAKTLIFSSFKEFLDTLEFPLSENGIDFIHLSKKSFQQNLENFKHDKDINVLLIPLNFGAAGINIIEATHVLLCEPVIETSKHQQAIGRVDRIGQEKETYVHRFVVSKTVEENIFHSTSENSSISNDATSEDVTVDYLLQLFGVN